MCRRGLKNVRRVETVQLGRMSWRLETLSGVPIPAFSCFCELYLDHPFSTRKRYAEAVSRFIDYLYEVGIFGSPVQAAHLNAAVTAYPALLIDGSKVLAERIRKGNTDGWLAEAAERLDWSPLIELSNSVAPVNKFLRLSESLARASRERALVLGMSVTSGPIVRIDTVDGFEDVRSVEVAAMKQNSMFGNVAKFAPKGITRTRGIAHRRCSRRKHDPDFPRESLAALIHNATSWRDKALWLMLAALGIRTSEALNVLLGDIDFLNQRVYIYDPSGRHAQMTADDPNRLRFKGRQCVQTFSIPELKSDLFFAIQKYIELEYVPCYGRGAPNYLFQYVQEGQRGRPYVDVSAEALRQNFLQACERASVPPPVGEPNWVIHSLRYMYAVYMVNDFPVDARRGQFGLPLSDVQLMLGHARIGTTARYARGKLRRIEARLKASDEAMMNMSEMELPTFNAAFNVKLQPGHGVTND